MHGYGVAAFGVVQDQAFALQSSQRVTTGQCRQANAVAGHQTAQMPGKQAAYGAHAHADNRKFGTRMTAWYTSVGTTCGSSANCTNRVGVPTL